jgi:uncharacterized protein (DUF305 family)
MRRMVAAAAAVVTLLGIGAGGAVLAHSDDAAGCGRHAMSMSHLRTTDEAAWLRRMIAHHEEAVSAAGELSRSADPAMRAFGRTVVADQSAQVVLMEGWLARWYPDEPADTAYDPMMRDLSGLTGAALDRAFLEDMIPHHMAAVMMSQHLLMGGGDAHDEVADLAATIRTDQVREIRWMRERLAGSFPDGARRSRCAWSRMGV